ncbi:MAG: hypothetical protein JRM99_05560 [Nitrososphaerota archaeon]|nr:hypothetical protein [Nitrososphaerota archaeon]
MKRLYFALILVIVLIGIASFIAVFPLLQAKPRPVNVTISVASYNGAGGCLNVASIPMSILKIDGVPSTANTTTPYSFNFNATTVTLMSGSSHMLTANMTFTGSCNGCAECGGVHGPVTATFRGWLVDGGNILSSSNILDFKVPSNESSILIIAGYWVD